MSEQFLFYVQVAFWALLLLLVHCYLLFPMTLPFVSEIFKRRKSPEKGDVELPTVSILISAFNEEAVIERKIQNILELDYPKEKLEVLIGDEPVEPGRYLAVYCLDITPEKKEFFLSHLAE